MNNEALTGIKTLEDFQLSGQRVFMRLDLNVPMKNGEITDDTRIQAALPSIRYALEKGAKLILASHLGRPKTESDFKDLSLEPVAQRLGELLNLDVMLIEELRGDAPKALLQNLRAGQVLLLENLRFDEDETKNGAGLTHALAEYTDIYINDAFGASHRAHASVVGLPGLISQKGCGFLIKKELEVLGGLLKDPEAPFVAILGGAKVSDKIPVIESLMEKVDAFIVGGAMSYTFLVAQGINVGDSLVEKDKVKFAEDLLRRLELRNKKIYLPLDHMVVPKINAVTERKITPTSAIDEGWMGVDIGPVTQRAYANVIEGAKTIIWNGPMGIFETPEYSEGTFAVAKAMASSEGFTVVGGGDSASAANLSGYANKMDHISTGGGASLEFLQGLALPGLQALRDQVKRSEVIEGKPFL